MKHPRFSDGPVGGCTNLSITRSKRQRCKIARKPNYTSYRRNLLQRVYRCLYHLCRQAAGRHRLKHLSPYVKLTARVYRAFIIYVAWSLADLDLSTAHHPCLCDEWDEPKIKERLLLKSELVMFGKHKKSINTAHRPPFSVLILHPKYQKTILSITFALKLCIERPLILNARVRDGPAWTVKPPRLWYVLTAELTETVSAPLDIRMRIETMQCMPEYSQ